MIGLKVVACILALAFGCSLADRPPGCEKFGSSPFANNSDDDHMERNSASLTRRSCNETTIGVKWTVTGDDLIDLCGFSLHWYGENDRKRGVVSIERDVTTYLVTDLSPGSKYLFHVTTYYATQHNPRSWLLITFTTGCGPDVTFCNPKGTERCDSSTGQCVCKTDSTTGDRCDQCPRGFYLHDHGCVSCDNCISDGITSNGTCKPADDPLDTMKCDCFYPYTGKHCRECEKGFHWKDRSECVPCECHHDEGAVNKSSMCDQYTGKCECPVGRTGDRCERCADGNTKGCVLTPHDNVGLTVPVTYIAVIVVVVIVFVVFVALFLICRRHGKNRISEEFWRVYLRDDYDKINFKTLEEEPESDWDKAKA